MHKQLTLIRITENMRKALARTQDPHQVHPSPQHTLMITHRPSGAQAAALRALPPQALEDLRRHYLYLERLFAVPQVDLSRVVDDGRAGRASLTVTNATCGTVVVHAVATTNGDGTESCACTNAPSFWIGVTNNICATLAPPGSQQDVG